MQSPPPSVFPDSRSRSEQKNIRSSSWKAEQSFISFWHSLSLVMSILLSSARTLDRKSDGMADLLALELSLAVRLGQGERTQMQNGKSNVRFYWLIATLQQEWQSKRLWTVMRQTERTNIKHKERKALPKEESYSELKCNSYETWSENKILKRSAHRLWNFLL